MKSSYFHNLTPFDTLSVYSELMPRLPTDGIFAVDALLKRGTIQSTDAAIWQWKDDGGIWRPYSQIDNRILEVGYLGFHRTLQYFH